MVLAPYPLLLIYTKHTKTIRLNILIKQDAKSWLFIYLFISYVKKIPIGFSPIMEILKKAKGFKNDVNLLAYVHCLPPYLVSLPYRSSFQKGAPVSKTG
jgi:hypothetical protein